MECVVLESEIIYYFTIYNLQFTIYYLRNEKDNKVHSGH